MARYIYQCLEYQKVKEEHKHHASRLHPFPMVEWKWNVVIIDFIKNLPRTLKQHDYIMVVVKKLTKLAHFIPIELTFKEYKIAEIYMKEISRLLDIPKEIVSDQHPKFTSNFWKGLF